MSVSLVLQKENSDSRYSFGRRTADAGYGQSADVEAEDYRNG